MKKILFSLFMVLGLSSQAFAEEAVAVANTPAQGYDRNTAVTLEHKGNDSLGARLAVQLKEDLNTSSLFTLEEEDTRKFRIILETVPEFDTRPAIGSAYSITWVFSQNEAILGHYIASEVGVFTADEIEGLAAKVLEKTDTFSVRYGYLFEASE